MPEILKLFIFLCPLKPEQYTWHFDYQTHIFTLILLGFCILLIELNSVPDNQVWTLKTVLDLFRFSIPTRFLPVSPPLIAVKLSLSLYTLVTNEIINHVSSQGGMSKRNIFQTTFIILKNSGSHIKQIKKKTDEITFDSTF